ncbi:MAG: hypothetical protein BroJett018_21850 [Chloroflexota bacterium]|nr:hypothetical protein [Chloroflexota bacterium]NOG65476.1 metal-sensing transcriptional repressor [Chloroflexota bacterium]GIK64391.1 MAG: hypothetical protein BroJett018_21850 [Chloroflexota bacterium]
MKKTHLHCSDKELLAHQLRLQGEALKECILMFEQGDSCIEVIKRIQTIESALSIVITQLLNIYLTKCLAKLSKMESVDTDLHEISGLYGCLDNPPEKVVEMLQ